MEKGPHFPHIKVLWLYSVDIVDIIENWATMKSLIDSKRHKVQRKLKMILQVQGTLLL